MANCRALYFLRVVQLSVIRHWLLGNESQLTCAFWNQAPVSYGLVTTTNCLTEQTWPRNLSHSTLCDSPLSSLQTSAEPTSINVHSNGVTQMSG